MSKKLGQKRRKLSQEFKQDAVKLAIDQGMKCTEAARDLGVDQNTLSRWVAEFKAGGPAAFPGKGHLKPDDQRLKDLEARVKRLTMERDILKKAMAYFVDVPK